MTWLLDTSDPTSGQRHLSPVGDQARFRSDGVIDQIHRSDSALPATSELIDAGFDEATAQAVRWAVASHQATPKDVEQLAERVAAATYFDPSRRSARLTQPTDWVTLKVLDNGMWNEPLWRADDPCGGVQSFAQYCSYVESQPPRPKLTATSVDLPLVAVNARAMPCPSPWFPFTIQRAVSGNVWLHTAEDMDAAGFSIINDWAQREALRILYSGKLANGSSSALGNEYIVEATVPDPDIQQDWDLTPVAGAVTINQAIGMLSSALSNCQPARSGLILVPQAVMDGHIDVGTMYQDQIGRWRTRSGHGILGSSAFSGNGPGDVAPSAGEAWFYAVGAIDMVLGRPWSPQRNAVAENPGLVRWQNTLVPRAYGVHNSAGVFQNALFSEYFVQGAVAFGGCCRFAVRVRL